MTNFVYFNNKVLIMHAPFVNIIVQILTCTWQSIHTWSVTQQRRKLHKPNVKYKWCNKSGKKANCDKLV